MKIPDQNIEAEQSLLASLLLNNRAFSHCEFLRPEEFYKTDHQTYFRTMSKMRREKQEVDLVTLGEELRRQGELTQDRALYLSRIVDNSPVMDTRQYVKIIQESALTRAVKEKAMSIIDSDLHGEHLLSQAQTDILGVQSSIQEDNIKPVKDIVIDHLERLEMANTTEEQAGYKTGFPSIDKKLRLMDGKLVFVAARPGMGKTSFAVTVARNLDKTGVPVGFLSIEMPETEIMDRWLSMESKIPLDLFGKYNAFDREAIQTLNDAAAVLYDSNIQIDASGSLEIHDVERKCRKMVKAGAKVLFIDQLNQIKNRETRTVLDRTTENIMRLSCLKKELNIPIFLLHQLNRDAKHRTNKEPLISDLKDSGRAEEDADAILFVYRPEVDAPDNEKAALHGRAIVDLAKNRQGPTYKDNTVKFRHETTYFYQGMM